MKYIDAWLDSITMYRIAIYYLLMLLGAAIGLSAFGQLGYKPLEIIFISAYLFTICYVVNLVFAKAWKAAASNESSVITALILALIITPTITQPNLIFLTAASGLAIASKYILAINKKHIFNPAAIAVVLTSLGGQQSASWWIGNIKLLPFVLVGGFLFVRKIKRSRMVWAFVISAAVANIIYNLMAGKQVSLGLSHTLFHSALFFMAFVMLTEPQTSPTTKTKQTWYGTVAGFLFPPQVHLLTTYSTPELVLVVSNIFAYIISPKAKLLPKLIEKTQLAPGLVDFVFSKPQSLAYLPGQYMEWTFPHDHIDSRGNRRYFSLASSPTEDNLRLGIKFYDNGSSYKQSMLKMDSNSLVGASQLGGDFVLPKNKNKKLAFIAGGIGITPFRSMIKYLVDKNEQRDFVMLYSERTATAVVYTDVFEEARQKLGSKIVYTLSDQSQNVPKWALTGVITPEMIKTQIPDYQERLFYISGPPGMVHAMKNNLHGLGIKSKNIKTDFFPGYM